MSLLFKFLKAVFSDLANALDPNPREKPARHPFARFDTVQDRLDDFKSYGQMHEEAKCLNENWQVFSDGSPDEDHTTSHSFPQAKGESHRLQGEVIELPDGVSDAPEEDSGTSEKVADPGPVSNEGNSNEEVVEADFESSFDDDDSGCGADQSEGYDSYIE